MHRYELAVLKALSGKGSVGLDAIISSTRLGKDEILWAIENLKEKDFVDVSYSSKEMLELTDEGRRYKEEGLPEVQLVEMAAKRSIKAADLKSDKERIGLQWAKTKGWISIANGEIRLTESGKKVASSNEKPEPDRTEQIKRKLGVIVTQKSITGISITNEGSKALQSGGSEEGTIDSVDRSVISNELWKGKKFKSYDVKVGVEAQIPAKRHPLKRLIEDIKDAYVSMGFQEVSGPAVESSFWTFDALFVPQDHPARDAQDTFYTSNLKNAPLEEPHITTVKRAHQKGWHSKWSEDVASQMLLRTHTTSVSARQIYRIVHEISANKARYDLPVKLFSIGRVFRNEAIDYRHLADFYQHDGIIIGKDLTFANLFDTLRKIYDYLGIEIRFKPSYFPFVEPGVEFMAYVPSRDEWIEIGGAGFVREEITGVSRKKLTVLAWGPGLDRTLLIKDKSINSIVELYGGNIGWLRNRKM